MQTWPERTPYKQTKGQNMQKGRPEGLCQYSIEVPLNCGPRSIYKEWSDKVMRKERERKESEEREHWKKRKEMERKENSDKTISAIKIELWTNKHMWGLELAKGRTMAYLTSSWPYLLEHHRQACLYLYEGKNPQNTNFFQKYFVPAVNISNFICQDIFNYWKSVFSVV